MNPATALATVLVDELARCGLAEAVIAPGSRNAPLAMALWEQAARSAGRLRLHVRVDERSAAFLALGLAKLSRRPGNPGRGARGEPCHRARHGARR